MEQKLYTKNGDIEQKLYTKNGDIEQKLYTKNGDTGKSSTISRTQLSKADPLFDILGTLDECTSALGLAKASAKCFGFIELEDAVDATQKDLSTLCGILAGMKSDFIISAVADIEAKIDWYQEKSIGFHGFIMPGKNSISAGLDMARSIARRTEREAVGASQKTYIDKRILVYLNRLSDLLYSMARYADTIDFDSNVKSRDEVVNSVEVIQSVIDDSSSIEKMVAKMVAEHISLENSLNTKSLSLVTAKSIAKDVELKAVEMGINVVVSIVDAGSNLMLLEAMDNSYLASVNIAWDKAYTAVSLKMPTETVGELSKQGGALEGLVATSENRIMFLAGGAPLKIGEHILGGIGVSGGTASDDKLLAHYGAEIFKKYML